MSAPRWSRALLRRLAPPGREDEILGDLEEVHRRRTADRGRFAGYLLTAFETLDMAVALLRQQAWRPGISLLDLKLGFRMLVRYPGLTGLGGLAIAFAIFAGAGTFEFLRQVAFPTLPFEGGDRLVGVQLWNAREGDDHGRGLYELGVWRNELTSIEELGAFDSVVRNLIVDGGGAELVTGAEIDASGFRLTGVEPILGRTLTEEDERPAAPLVVVLGYDVWQNVLGADPAVVGRVVRVGTEAATVVGVMPEGFTFPVSHQLWLPLRADPGNALPAEGPTVTIFGRLAAGASLDRAQAELDRVGEGLSAAHPETHEHVRAFVKPYARAMLGLPPSISGGLVSLWAIAWNIPLVLFLVLVCGNVALLMFARTAARESELVVRSALGARRRRIVGQLFAEALVLAGVGAVVGLSVAGYGLRWAYHIVEVELWEGPLPFWFHPELSFPTVVYALLLAVVAAVVAGVVPGLKATGSGLVSALRQSSAGGGGFRFGGIWTAIIVTQIALALTFPAVSFAVGMEGRDIAIFDMGIPAEQYLTAAVGLQPPVPDPGAGSPDTAQARAAVAARARTTLRELEEKLLADSRVRGVTFAEAPPRQYNGWNQVEVDGPTAPPQDERGHRLGRVAVEADFFRTLGVPVRRGRDFHSADAEPGSDVVIVNEAFVDYVLGGRNAVDVQFRFVDSERDASVQPENPGPWLRIVGVVQDLGRMSGYSSAVVYEAVPDGSMNPVYAIVHAPGDALGFAPRLRQIAFDVDPTLRIGETLTLDQMVDSTVDFYRFWVLTLAMVSGVGVVLSLAGIYAVMSFTVARRTREIGVRSALGASHGRILLGIFRRPLVQVGLGILAGALLSGLLLGLANSDPEVSEFAWFAVYVLVMTGVCMAACAVPTRQALTVEPSEALRAE